MALKKCHECGNTISTDAKICPQCGAKPRKNVGLVGIIIALFVGYAIFSGVSEGEKQKSDKATSEAAKTPEQKAHDAKKDIQLQAAAASAIMLKKASKDPDSFELKSAIVHPSGAACYEYRAVNSFGAHLQGRAMLTPKGKMLAQESNGDAFSRAWNKECTKADGDDIADYLIRMKLI